MANLKIDLGCGLRKKAGTLGIDIYPHPGVDYVLDLQTEPIPCSDRSVEYVYSSHFLEHIKNPIPIFQEISRVCIDGAKLEFWTPYGWSNSAFIFGHELFFNEDHYLHLCVWHSDLWSKTLKARWLLKEFTYVIDPIVLVELYRHQTPIDFAIKYFKDCVREFGVLFEVRHEYKGDNFQPIRTFALDRSSKRYPIHTKNEADLNSIEIEQALRWLSSSTLDKSLPYSMNSQLDFEQSQFVPQDTHAELQQLRYQLQHKQVELQQARTLIEAMQTSKFWKLRNAWFKLKKLMGQ
jgi:SAM-dependent methyltransferase